ncbi:unnamed protein product [Rotaria magnacalcarata]|uniref:F-box domain-containing protein n=1 Tax=Rotaria magnacalcarata TaxID=392030 RepID=A0A815W615_9BILA|nr:unnamed protein product [Rotaria magnacalcarata]CAF1543757.1 unnamed protein product [Rotaria magnacalcarata]CAF2114986.1 unnamed protein product [Rotaria magnacalcarata]CAF3779479.1 unnamed protein product [Rotaria magnacalcarata]CAF3793603.1 unnamed protein product [Rotaria magnacalcarata]
MKDLLVQLEDLPDEILMYIFKKLSNDEVLYSLTDVNQRFNRIVHDTIFTRYLCLLEYCADDNSTYPLPDPILDRLCSKILPAIGHQIESLFLERTSIKRVLHATNYPHLVDLGLCNFHFEDAMSLFFDQNPLAHIFKNQISSLFISFGTGNNSFPLESIYSLIFSLILANFTNLRCLKFNSSLSFNDTTTFHVPDETTISSTLLELHVSVADMTDCMCMLDGRFDQLRVFYITVYSSLPRSLNFEHEQKLLPNLRIFSFCCKEKINNFDESIVPLLRRMLNLEELDLNIIVKSNEKFIDGDTLKKDIIIYMPRLYKFTFNICSTIDHRNQTNFQLNKHIEKTFKYFSNNQIITCIDHFQEEGYSQCHIYSYPYKLKVYKNITNNFRGGLFTSVTQVSLYDERPFEHEFFLQIQKSFPFLKELTIKNRKAQNNKQYIKSNNDNQVLSIIEYHKLTRLDLTNTHDDYVELFLFDTKMSLPNNLHLCVDYQILERVTYYFTRYISRNNCEKLAALYCYPVDRIDERVQNYFPLTCIHRAVDFVISK